MTERFVPDKLYLVQPADLPAGDGGRLHLAAGEFLPLAFSFVIGESDDETDWLESRVRLTDDQGRVWEGRAIRQPSEIIGQMTDFGNGSWPVTESEAPPEWIEALEQRAFFTGARDLLDDRFYRRLYLEDRLWYVPFKYQGPTLDLAFHREETVGLVRVIARVSGLYAFPSLEDRSPVDLPPICFETSVHHRLFENNWVLDEEGEWDLDPIPRTVVFQETGVRGDPVPGIRFVPPE
jgi:hypothetical protein